MLLLTEFFVALFFVILVLAGLHVLGSRHRTWANLLVIFVLLLLATWTLGSWMERVGPAMWGVYWAPFAITAVVVGLLAAAVGALMSEVLPETKESAEEQAASSAGLVISLFFWLFLIVAAALLLSRYWNP